MVKLGDYPEEGELVICTVTKVEKFGAFVFLEEYQKREGFIHISEVASGWVKHIGDFVRVGKRLVCKVLKVNLQKGHVDLSLKQVNKHQRQVKLQEWKNENRADHLFEEVARRVGLTTPEAYDQFGKRLIEVFGSIYGAFEEAALDAETLESENFKGPWVAEFLDVARANIVPPHVVVKGTLTLTNPRGDGIVHICKALEAAQQVSRESISIKYLGAPLYRIQVRALEYKEAEELLRAALKETERLITKTGGSYAFAKA